MISWQLEVLMAAQRMHLLRRSDGLVQPALYMNVEDRLGRCMYCFSLCET